jgi:hypothetical protein
MRSTAFRWLACAGILLTVVACGDAGPVSGPGTLTAVLVSPNGAEGAAVISFPSAGVAAVGPVGGEIFSRVDGGTMTVVIINEPGGELSFSVSLADTLQQPVGSIEQVAGPDDELRTTLSGYSLEFRR